MNTTSLLVMIAIGAVVTAATVWRLWRFLQPPTPAAKKRLTVVLCFIVAQFVIVNSLVLLSVQHVLQPRMLGILGLVNLVCSSLILGIALKRAPISDRDVTREQRVRAVRSSKILIGFYLVCLFNGLFHIRQWPAISIAVGVLVNALILTALVKNLRRNQAKLVSGEQ